VPQTRCATAGTPTSAFFNTPTICSREKRLFFIGKILHLNGRGYGRRLTFTVVQNTRGRSTFVLGAALLKFIVI